MIFFNLTDRVALVTGAAQGLGLAMVQRFATAGASVAVVDINRAGAEEVAQNLRAHGGDATPFACDISDRTSVEKTFEDVLKRYNRIDILVNNAGISGGVAPIQDVTDEDWSAVMAVDLTGVFYCCRAVIPHMIERKKGRIINIASVAGKEGNPNMIPYCAAKAGVICLTKALAKEVATRNITVNVVTPGLLETTLANNLTPEQEKYLLGRIPMGRMGHPEELASLVHCLASDEASFSTGAVFDLSGGRATY